MCDNAIMAQDFPFYAQDKDEKGIVEFKVDSDKAHDRVDQGFLHQTLVDLSFPSKMVNFIMSCVHSSSLSILWNRVKLESITSLRGLR